MTRRTPRSSFTVPPSSRLPATVHHYRPDIDGLRALAVGSVLLFHAGVPWASGGFVGVDAFLVISGFLITGIIARELAEGRFSMPRFFMRRVRRLLPGLLIVLSATWCAGALLLSPEALAALSRSLVATLAVGANVHFWRQSGYFDPDVEKAPLLHMWSLSLEEQYYLLFPLVLMAVWRVHRRLLVPTLWGGLVTSFALALWATLRYPGAAFYLLPTRAWELLLGGVVALGMQHHGWPLRRATARQHDALAAAGALLLLAPVALYDRHTAFPGVAALAPALGTALMLATTRPTSRMARLLSWRPLVALGLISYCAYLWHQPLFVLYRAWALDAPSPGMIVVLLGMTILLAWLTWRFVTQPSRAPAVIPTPVLLRRLALGGGLAVALAVVGTVSGGLPWRLHIPESVLASMAEPSGADGCFDRPVDGDPTLWQCALGSAGRAPTFFVTGDSHARALYPALVSAVDSLGRSGRLAGRNGCVPLLGVHVYRPRFGWTDCRALAERVFEQVRASGIGTVILVARWSYYTSGDYTGRNRALVAQAAHRLPAGPESDAVLAAAFDSTLARYAAIGVRVIVVDQVPQQLATADEIYSHIALVGAEPPTHARLAERSVPVRRHVVLQARMDTVLRAAIRRHGGRVDRVSLDSVYCDGAHCLVGEPTVSWYADADHLSPEGARRAVPSLRQVLGTLAPVTVSMHAAPLP
jgi:peptidoglycan/LPS O-acetylase OafA/YrhL